MRIVIKLSFGATNGRFIDAVTSGFGANRCTYYFDYSKHLVPCFNEYTEFIKRK